MYNKLKFNKFEKAYLSIIKEQVEGQETTEEPIPAQKYERSSAAEPMYKFRVALVGLPQFIEDCCETFEDAEDEIGQDVNMLSEWFVDDDDIEPLPGPEEGTIYSFYVAKSELAHFLGYCPLGLPNGMIVQLTDGEISVDDIIGKTPDEILDILDNCEFYDETSFQKLDMTADQRPATDAAEFERLYVDWDDLKEIYGEGDGEGDDDDDGEGNGGGEGETEDEE